MKILRYLPLAILLGVILFFGLRPSPNPGDAGLLPSWLAQGGDMADAGRNFFAFFLLTIAALVAFRPFLVYVLLSVAALVIGIEAVQNILPDRWLQWTDILQGLLGVAAAGFLGYLFRSKEST